MPLIPSPDRVRCPNEHPDYGFRCMLAYGHEMFSRHRWEQRDALRQSATYTVYMWGTHAKSEFEAGPFVDSPAIQSREESMKLT